MGVLADALLGLVLAFDFFFSPVAWSSSTLGIERDSEGMSRSIWPQTSVGEGRSNVPISPLGCCAGLACTGVLLGMCSGEIIDLVEERRRPRRGER